MEEYSPPNSPPDSPKNYHDPLLSMYVEHKAMLIQVYDPIEVNEKEMDPNKTTYFLNVGDDIREVISPSTIRKMIKYPRSSEFNWLQNLMMLNSKNEEVPAHMPNLRDLWGYPIPVQILIKRGMDKLDEEDSVHVVPPELVEIMDPKPIVDYNKPVTPLFDDSSVLIYYGDYTDGLDVLKLEVPMARLSMKVARMINTDDYIRRKYRVSINARPWEKNIFVQTPPIPQNTTILVWNTRGVARLSFWRHFSLLHAIHRPQIFVLLETRCGKRNIEDCIKRLPEEYKVHEKYECARAGGAALLWSERTFDVIVETVDPGRYMIEAFVEVRNPLLYIPYYFF